MSVNFQTPTTTNWRKRINWAVSSCAAGMSKSIVSEDGEYFYSFILYDNLFLYYTLKVSDGNQLTSGLKQASGGQLITNIQELSDYLVVISQSTSEGLRLHFIDPIKSLMIREYSQSAIFYGASKYIVNGDEYLILAGTKAVDLYAGKIYKDNLAEYGDFSEVTTTWSKIGSDYDIRDLTSISTPSTPTMIISQSTSGVSINDMTGYSTSIKEHIALWVEDFNETYVPNSNIKIESMWAWYPSTNITNIEYSLVDLGEPVPDWVQIDSSTGYITFDRTPTSFTEKVYPFAIEIHFDSKTSTKNFYITIEAWPISNWAKWNSIDTKKWDEWSSDTTLSLDFSAWGSKADNQIIISQVALVIGVLFVIGASLLFMSSPNTLFSIINQFQLFILLPLIPNYFPAKLTDLILGMDFALLSFDFIPTDWIPFIKQVKKWIAYPQTDSYFNEIGLSSGSWIINYLPYMVFFIFLGLIHLLIFFLYKWLSNSSKCKCNIVSKFIKFIFIYFTLGIYIRIIMEIFLFVNISIQSELKMFDLSSSVTIVSIVFWILFTLCILTFFIFSIIVYYWSFPSISKEKLWIWMEFFADLRDAKYAKMNSVLFMAIRMISVFIIIFTKDIAYKLKVASFIIIHFIYTIFFVGVRPFTTVKHNLIESLNQIIFFILSIPLIHLRSKKDWKNLYEDIYLGTLIAGPIIGWWVILTDFFINLYK